MLGDDIAAALPELRAHAESMMRDTVKVERATGAFTRDPVTLEDVPVYATVHEGQARIQRPGGIQPSEEVAGEVEFGISTILAQLPLSTTGVERGDRLTVTAIGPLSDPDLLGLKATVMANLTKSHPTKRTLVCEEVT
jgi:hypothetical protein